MADLLLATVNFETCISITVTLIGTEEPEKMSLSQI